MSCGYCPQCPYKCDVCIDCDTGDYRGCNTQQTFCSGDKMQGQLASAYIGSANAPSFGRDDLIIKKFPPSELAKWLQYVSDAGNYTGELPSYSITGGWSPPGVSGEFVYADIINELLKGIIAIGGPNAVPPMLSRDDIIYSDFYNQLSAVLNSLSLNPGACESCVSGCNVTCDTCNTCDSCISCNSCQGNTSYSSYYNSYSS